MTITPLAGTNQIATALTTLGTTAFGDSETELYTQLLVALSEGGSGPVPPTPPQNLLATAGDREATLVWDAVAGATSYVVYQSLTDDFNAAVESSVSPVVANTASPTFAASEVGNRYYFFVVASNAVGDSTESASAFARPYITIAADALVELNCPTGTWVLTTLFFRSAGNLPELCTVLWNGGDEVGVALGDGTWEDAVNSGTYDPAIAGVFQFLNASAPTTIWDAEP